MHLLSLDYELTFIKWLVPIIDSDWSIAVLYLAVLYETWL